MSEDDVAHIISGSVWSVKDVTTATAQLSNGKETILDSVNRRRNGGGLGVEGLEG